MSIAFPVDCTANPDRVKFCEELDEKLRLRHNIQCSGKGKRWAQEFFAAEFYPQSAAVHEQLNINAAMVYDPITKIYKKQKIGGPAIWRPSLDVITGIGVAVIPPDPLQDFTTYTEVDPSGTIERTPSTITVANFKRTEDARVCDDKGVDHFDGDFEHLLDCEATSRSGDWGSFAVWALTNTADDLQAILDASGSFFSSTFLWRPTQPRLEIDLLESDAGTLYQDIWLSPSIGTQYWKKIKRDEVVGSFGQIQNFIYDDGPNRTNLVVTLSISLHTSKKNFRYYNGVNSWNNSADTSRLISGYSQNHDLQEPVVGNPHYAYMNQM